MANVGQCIWSLGWNLWAKREKKFAKFSKMITSSNSGRRAMEFPKCLTNVYWLHLKTDIFRFVWIQVPILLLMPSTRAVILRMLTDESGNIGRSPRWICAFSCHRLNKTIVLFQYSMAWNWCLQFLRRRMLDWWVGSHHRNNVFLADVCIWWVIADY